MSDAHINFVRQQGFEDVGGSCAFQYPGLMFQPRVIGMLVVAGVLLQSATFFLILSAILWWSTFVPALNPFEKLYNLLFASPKGLPTVAPAPAPRRFSQGMAATFMLTIGASLAAGWITLAWIGEALLVAALVALIFGRFCLGSFIFHVLSGKLSFARRTLPWARSV